MAQNALLTRHFIFGDCNGNGDGDGDGDVLDRYEFTFLVAMHTQ